MHAALWEALHAGLVFRLGSTYKFLHDRIQQAAYSLIPEEHRADTHLRIGRVLWADMSADELSERLFDVANQLNHGATRVVDRAEKTLVATIDLHTGRKAKAAAAYVSACVYFGPAWRCLTKPMGRPLRVNVQSLVGTRGVRVPDRAFRHGRKCSGTLLERGVSKSTGRPPIVSRSSCVSSSGIPASGVSALTCLRCSALTSGTSDLGTGPGRIRGGLPQTWRDTLSKA